MKFIKQLFCKHCFVWYGKPQGTHWVAKCLRCEKLEQKEVGKLNNKYDFFGRKV